MGKVDVEKIFLSAKQEFIKITIEDILEWKDICRGNRKFSREQVDRKEILGIFEGRTDRLQL